MPRPKGSKNLQITPELIASIKTMASIGLTKQEILNSLNRTYNCIFNNNTELDNAYDAGKMESKASLLANINSLAKGSKSDPVRLSASQYILNINHKVIPSNNMTLESNPDKPIVFQISKMPAMIPANDIVIPSSTT